MAAKKHKPKYRSISAFDALDMLRKLDQTYHCIASTPASYEIDAVRGRLDEHVRLAIQRGRRR